MTETPHIHYALGRELVFDVACPENFDYCQSFHVPPQ